MPQEKEMSFLGHLEALRGHLWRSALAMVVGSVVAFFFTPFLFDEIIFGPFREDFISKQWFCTLAEWLHADALCLGKVEIKQFLSRKMSGQFIWHIYGCMVAGIIMAFPYIIWELWRFVKPALHEKEIKTVRGITFFISLLFFLGVAFGYFMIAPITIHFLGNYRVSAFIENAPDFDNYISTLLSLTLGTGLVFQLPVLVYFLTKLGVLGPAFLRKYRRHAFVIILILSAIITPPDVASQILLTLPLSLLYEVSIWVSASVQRSKDKQQNS
jgi:sec-independent protein translocase protein TatC